MILSVILLVLVLLLLAILILFLYYMLFPSVSGFSAEDDPLISAGEVHYDLPHYEETKVTEKKALVLCSCAKKTVLPPTKFNPAHSCFTIKSVYGSGKDCRYACIGLGDCSKVCPQGAISVQNETAIISDLCCGCGQCVDICPQQIITLVSKNASVVSLCSNMNKESLTSCDSREKEQKISWNPRKDFKIWAYCYRIVKHIRSL